MHILRCMYTYVSHTCVVSIILCMNAIMFLFSL